MSGSSYRHLHCGHTCIGKDILITFNKSQTNTIAATILTIVFFFLLNVFYASNITHLGAIIFLSAIAYSVIAWKLATFSSFWLTYYICLSSIYFTLGYLNWVSENATTQSAKVVIGIMHFMPAVVFALSLVSKTFVGLLTKNFKLTLLYLFYVSVVILIYNYSGDINDKLVYLRNFTIFIFSFLLGINAKKVKPDSFFLAIIVVITLYVVFGFAEQSVGWYFWDKLFNTYFVTELKGSGMSSYGMIGSKTTYWSGDIIIRMSSVYYEPHHLSITLAYMSLLLIGFYMSNMLKLDFFFVSVLFCVFASALFLTFVKSGYGLFICGCAWWLYFRTMNIYGIYRSNKRSKLHFILLSASSVILAFVLTKLLIILSIENTANTHLAAAMSVFESKISASMIFGNIEKFQVLNSDSGFATIVHGIGFLGYFLFVMVMAEMLHFLSKQHGRFRFYGMALILGWFSVTHLVSSTWSPMVSFLLFFLLGLSTNMPNSVNVKLCKPQEVLRIV